MACETFLKIVSKCKRKFVIMQASSRVVFNALTQHKFAEAVTGRSSVRAAGLLSWVLSSQVVSRVSAQAMQLPTHTVSQLPHFLLFRRLGRASRSFRSCSRG